MKTKGPPFINNEFTCKKNVYIVVDDDYRNNEIAKRENIIN